MDLTKNGSWRSISWYLPSNLEMSFYNVTERQDNRKKLYTQEVVGKGSHTTRLRQLFRFYRIDVYTISSFIKDYNFIIISKGI